MQILITNFWILFFILRSFIPLAKIAKTTMHAPIATAAIQVFPIKFLTRKTPDITKTIVIMILKILLSFIGLFILLIFWLTIMPPYFNALHFKLLLNSILYTTYSYLIHHNIRL